MGTLQNQKSGSFRVITYWLENGYYLEGWGHTEPQTVVDLDFE